MRLIHKRRRRGCGSPSPGGKELGADAKSEVPVCEEAVASTLGGLQELELFALFAQHFHVEVAVGFDPVLVDFDRQRPDQAQSAFLIWEDANDMGAAFELLVK